MRRAPETHDVRLGGRSKTRNYSKLGLREYGAQCKTDLVRVPDEYNSRSGTEEDLHLQNLVERRAFPEYEADVNPFPAILASRQVGYGASSRTRSSGSKLINISHIFQHVCHAY